MFRLNALTGFKPLGPRVALDLVYSILKDYTRLASNGKTIVFCLIARHGNIRGSDTADAAAKSALTLPITKMKFPASELIPCVDRFCMHESQDIWDCCMHW